MFERTSVFKILFEFGEEFHFDYVVDVTFLFVLALLLLVGGFFSFVLFYKVRFITEDSVFFPLFLFLDLSVELFHPWKNRS